MDELIRLRSVGGVVMLLYAVLARNRQVEGTIAIVRRGVVGPRYRCRGEADNAGAAAHGNTQEDPTKPYGDHPFGVYRVMAIERLGFDPQKFGPTRVRLVGLDGEALQAERHGRSGIMIHGGMLHDDGSLRETYGCLRVDNTAIVEIANAIDEARAIGDEVLYICEPE